jgi:hypothetical protein
MSRLIKNFNKIKTRVSKGQTLLEAIIAIGVIMTGVIGSLVLVNTTIKLGRVNEDRLVAQNLAREGIELAYSLRNSATLVHAESPEVNWDSYLQGLKLKIDAYTAESIILDIGYDEPIGNTNPECAVGCCAFSTDNASWQRPDPPNSTNSTLNNCDLMVLINYIYRGTPSHLPEYCTNAMNPGANDCDWNGDGKLNLADIVYGIVQFYRRSWVTSPGGYPTISTATDHQVAKFEFNDDTASAPNSDETKIWNDGRSRVYSYDNSYIQNVSITGALPTKFYRVVNIQSVCRGLDLSDVEQNLVVPKNLMYSCEDYAEKVLHYDRSDWKKVGILVNSEVRWPNSTSSTKVVYQEYLYNWIVF